MNINELLDSDDLNRQSEKDIVSFLKKKKFKFKIDLEIYDVLNRSFTRRKDRQSYEDRFFARNEWYTEAREIIFTLSQEDGELIYISQRLKYLKKEISFLHALHKLKIIVYKKALLSLIKERDAEYNVNDLWSKVRNQNNF